MVRPWWELREELDGEGTDDDDDDGVPVSDGGTGSPMATWIFRSWSCTPAIQGVQLTQVHTLSLGNIHSVAADENLHRQSLL